jgi:hypothetical protein
MLLFILILIVILFTVSVGMILGRRDNKTLEEKMNIDASTLANEDNLFDDEII